MIRFPRCTLPLGCLILALIASAFLMARSVGGSGPAWLGWLALVPLFAAIRVLRPGRAALCGALWGACVFIFCLSAGVWHGEASPLPRADGPGTAHVGSPLVGGTNGVHTMSPLVGGEDAPGTSPDATISSVRSDPKSFGPSLPPSFRPSVPSSLSAAPPSLLRFVAPSLLLFLPTLYAFFGAWLTCRIGFSPFVLGVAWMFVELSFEPLGLRHGLLSGTQPADGLLIHYLGSAFGYVLLAFLVAWMNAALISGLALACAGIARAGLIAGVAGTGARPFGIFIFVSLYTRCHSHPRAPPSTSRIGHDT